MIAIRKGNDFEVRWSIFSDPGKTIPYDLTGRNLSLYLSNAYGVIDAGKFDVQGNVLRWIFYGKDQRQSGAYTLTLVENDGADNMHTVDVCRAFRLVNCSCDASLDGDGDENVNFHYIPLGSSMSFATPGEVIIPGGSIGIVELESYMPMMREFSDDFNDDFAR